MSHFLPREESGSRDLSRERGPMTLRKDRVVTAMDDQSGNPPINLHPASIAGISGVFLENYAPKYHARALKIRVR